MDFMNVEKIIFNDLPQSIEMRYENATIRNFRIVQNEGSRQVSREVKHYNLQMIIAIGFKVNSERAVQFRKWVNKIAKSFAESEFEKYRIVQDRLFKSDFDKLLEETGG